MLDSALQYARMGWHVFPVEPPTLGNSSSGKAPVGWLVENGKDDATTDEQTIRAWWGQGEWNIGINLARSGLVVLDVDTANGKKGMESLATFNHELTATRTARTGSGGIHALYARPDDLTELTAPQHLGARDGIDIIGKGYIVAAPSKHYSGGTYAWINETAIAPLPPLLRTLKRERIASGAPVSTRPPVKLDKNQKIIAASRLASAWPATGRHMAFLALAGALATHGWNEADITELTTMVATLMPGSDDKAIHDRPLQARDSVAKVSRGEAVAGWGSLATHIPEGVIRDVQENLAITDHSMDWANVENSADNILAELEAVPSQSDELVKYVDDICETEWPAVTSYSTGIEDVDRLLGGGVSTQQFMAMLGKPGAGKSAFVIGRVLQMSALVPELYVTTELQHNEVIARMASPLLLVPWRDLVRGKGFTPSGEVVTRKMMADAIRKASNGRIAIIGQDEIFKASKVGSPLELIGRTAYAMKEKFGVAPVVWVDYIQELMSGDDDPKKEITRVAVMLRILSQRLDCAIVGVSSVGRSGYGAAGAALRSLDDPTAYLALAKESGNIEYAAATLAYLDVGDERDGEGWRSGRIAVAKSRHGDVGFAGVRFHGATGRFEPWAKGVQAMSEEARGLAKVEKRSTELEDRVLAKVHELSLYPKSEHGLSSLLGKTELKTKVGGNSTECGQAIDRLIRTGKLMEDSETHTEPNTRKVLTRKIIALPSPNSASENKPISILEIIKPT